MQLAKLSVADTSVLPVDGTGCDRRVLAEEYGVWRGYYTEGFEISAFQWCDDSTRSIWVQYAEGAQARSPVAWPTHGAHDVPHYFVGFRGTLIGPFAYGHFGMSDYQLTVDSVLFARLPSRNDCGK